MEYNNQIKALPAGALARRQIKRPDLRPAFSHTSTLPKSLHCPAAVEFHRQSRAQSTLSHWGRLVTNTGDTRGRDYDLHKPIFNDLNINHLGLSFYGVLMAFCIGTIALLDDNPPNLMTFENGCDGMSNSCLVEFTNKITRPFSIVASKGSQLILNLIDIIEPKSLRRPEGISVRPQPGSELPIPASARNGIKIEESYGPRVARSLAQSLDTKYAGYGIAMIFFPRGRIQNVKDAARALIMCGKGGFSRFVDLRSIITSADIEVIGGFSKSTICFLRMRLFDSRIAARSFAIPDRQLASAASFPAFSALRFSSAFSFAEIRRASPDARSSIHNPTITISQKNALNNSTLNSCLSKNLFKHRRNLAIGLITKTVNGWNNAEHGHQYRVHLSQAIFWSRLFSQLLSHVSEYVLASLEPISTISPMTPAITRVVPQVSSDSQPDNVVGSKNDIDEFEIHTNRDFEITLAALGSLAIFTLIAAVLAFIFESTKAVAEESKANKSLTKTLDDLQ